MTKLSNNAKIVLSYLQEHAGEDLTHLDISEALGIAPRSVTGIVTGLQKRNFTERIETEGKEPKIIHATPEGIAFDVESELPEA